MSIHEEQLHAMQDGYDKNQEELFISSVSGLFSKKDMENFAAKCMILGNDGRTTNQLLQDFLDNDL